MNDERLQELLSEANSTGIMFRYDDGFVVAALSDSKAPEAQLRIIKELGKQVGLLRRFLMHRAVSERARALRGEQVWFPEFGLGTLVEASSASSVTVAMNNSKFSHLQANAEGLIILTEEKTPERPSCDSESALPVRRRIFGIF